MADKSVCGHERAVEDFRARCAVGYRPAKAQGYRFLSKSQKALACAHSALPGQVASPGVFIFDSSRHLRLRSKLLPDSHVVRNALGGGGR
jgi:hypothetical protein